MIPDFLIAALAIPLMTVLSASRDEAPASNASSLPSSVDLRPHWERWGLDRRQQGKRPTCSVFTVTGALEYAYARHDDRGTRLSVEFLNWAGHHAAERALDGGFFHELWDGYVAYGICPETDLPYQTTFDVELMPSATLRDSARKSAKDLRLHWIKEWNPQTGLTDAEFRAIRETLSDGWPVCGGFRWPKQAQWDEGLLKMCPPEDVFDGHSVLLVGYREDEQLPGGGAFIIRNSSGTGEDGLLSYEYVRAYMNDAAWIEARDAAPLP